MKKLIFISTLIVLSLAIKAQDAKALDDKYGFRNAIFETPFESFKNLIEIIPGSNIYRLKNEDLKIGDYDLYSIDYTFYNKKLSEINIIVKDYINREGVLKVLKLAYGDGIKSDFGITWRGEKVRMHYTDFNSNSAFNFEGAAIQIYSKKLMKMKDEASVKANIEASKKL
jgi:hypothetical protein